MTTQAIHKGKFLAAALLLTAACVAAFELPKEAVYPRIFSPNGDGINDAVFFNVADPLQEFPIGTIYDVDGGSVAEMKKAEDVLGTVPPPLSPEALMWDGKDRNGNTVRAGIYIYEVKNGDDAKTGTVVVAQ